MIAIKSRLVAKGSSEYEVHIVVHSGFWLLFCLACVIYSGGGYGVHLFFGLLLKNTAAILLKAKSEFFKILIWRDIPWRLISKVYFPK